MYLLFPEGDNKAACNNEPPANKYRHRRQVSEEKIVCYLKHHKESGYIDSCDLGKLYGSHVQRSSVKSESDCASQIQANSRCPTILMQCDSYNGIARRFQNCCQQDKPKNLHTLMVARALYQLLYRSEADPMRRRWRDTRSGDDVLTSGCAPATQSLVHRIAGCRRHPA